MNSLESLIRAASIGDDSAWTQLVAQLVPRIQAIVTSHEAVRSRGLSGLRDDVAEVTTATLERLGRDNRRNLARYLEQADQPDIKRPQTFDSWLYGAVDFTIRDHLRKRFGRAPKVVLGEPERPRPSKRDLGTAAGELDEEKLRESMVRNVGVTTRLTLLQIFAFVDTEFDAVEAEALRLHYLDELSFTELAKQLQLPDAAAAEKLVRRLNARLRYRFAAGG